ncbi:hypothetical protein L3Q82_006944 [Scortum barcoo]|uniref:Uncharacterized protein n=1 Tax=Scortum barcoo TaxID=214431 RepID=A0ACB8WW80_9TELE|nr:hypothetical protein L3Q82_006944 [Scortum barcoo]
MLIFTPCRDAASHPSRLHHECERVSERPAGGLQTDRQAICGPPEAELGHSGERPGRPAGPDDHHGCLRLQTSVPSVKDRQHRETPGTVVLSPRKHLKVRHGNGDGPWKEICGCIDD